MAKVKNQKNKTLQVVLGLLIRAVVLVFLVMAFYVVISTGYDFGHDLFTGEAVSASKGRKVTLSVIQGESVETVTRHLKEAGLIKNELKFRIQVIFYDKKILPGDYTFSTSMSSKEILGYLNKGPSSLEE